MDHKSRLTPDQRLALAQRFVEERCPGATLIDWEGSDGLTRAIYQKADLLISFRWIASMGSVAFASAASPATFETFHVIERTFGWGGHSGTPLDSPSFVDEPFGTTLERAGARMPDLIELFSRQNYPHTAYKIRNAREASIEANDDFDGLFRRERAPDETLIGAIRRGWREVIDELRAWRKK